MLMTLIRGVKQSSIDGQVGPIFHLISLLQKRTSRMPLRRTRRRILKARLKRTPCMVNKVNAIMYDVDVEDFLGTRVEKCCELAKVDRKTLRRAATPFHEAHIAKPIDPDKEPTGKLAGIASRVQRKWPDGIFSVQPPAPVAVSRGGGGVTPALGDPWCGTEGSASPSAPSLPLRCRVPAPSLSFPFPFCYGPQHLSSAPAGFPPSELNTT